MRKNSSQTPHTSKYESRQITIKHSNYNLIYDIDLHYPILVNWIEANQELIEGSTSVDRGTSFKADPTLNEDIQQVWTSDEYDRGHNCPAKDNEFSEQAEDESFYYTNMTPQHPNLNRITWKKLEEITRNLAKESKKVEIWCGAFGDKGKIDDLITIPEYCWKVIKYGEEIILGFIMPNSEEVSDKHYIQYITTIDDIRKKSGLSLEDIK